LGFVQQIAAQSPCMVEAAMDGLGIAFVPEIYAGEQIAAGRLVSLLEDCGLPYSALTLCYPGRRHVPSALRALIDLMKEPGMTSAMKRQ
jgi:DNA-binding transcriptional LysR family regulator